MLVCLILVSLLGIYLAGKGKVVDTGHLGCYVSGLDVFLIPFPCGAEVRRDPGMPSVVDKERVLLVDSLSWLLGANSARGNHLVQSSCRELT